MTDTPKKTTSVIIVSYQTGPALWVCLYRLLQLKGLHEIIVVNNGNDSVVEAHLLKLEQKHPPLRLLTGHGNVGFATGCNLGAQQATGDYVLLLNPDAVLMESDAFQRFIDVLEQPGVQPPVGLVGGILRNEDGSEQRGSRRHLLTPQNALAEGLGLNAPAYRLNITDEPLPQQPAPVPAISGACMMMERARYVQMRGLDENYFLHVEDLDFCKRVHDAGGAVWVSPQVNVLHYRSTSAVNNLFVERKKAAGFHRYFQVHHYRNRVWRVVIDTAVTLRLGLKITASFFENENARPRICDAPGLRRVQAIVRGVEAALAGLRNKVPAPIEAGKTVFITGATTPIALFTIGRLLAYGCKVVALKHETLLGFFHPNLRWVEGDLQNPTGLQDALQGITCDYALHCAPIWHVGGLAKLLKRMGVRHVVAFSSTSLLTKANSISQEEKDTATRLEAGEATLKAEADAEHVKYTIIRPTMIYGAGLDSNISRIARVVDDTHRFILPKEATGLRAPVHADDLALAAIHAFASHTTWNRTYTLQGGEVLRYQEMVRRIFRTMGLPEKVIPVPKLGNLCAMLHGFLPSKVPHPAIARRMADDLVFTDEAALKDLNIVPRPFLQDGMVDLGKCEEATCRSLLPA